MVQKIEWRSSSYMSLRKADARMGAGSWWWQGNVKVLIARFLFKWRSQDTKALISGGIWSNCFQDTVWSCEQKCRLIFVYSSFKHILYKIQCMAPYQKAPGVSQSVLWLATWWMFRVLNPCGGEIFCISTNRPWRPLSLLFNGYRGLFPGRETTGAWPLPPKII